MSKLSETPTPELENEAAALEEEGRRDRAQNERRDWRAEANDDMKDSDEVLAERTLFNARCRRRDAAIEHLNDELERRAKADVDGRMKAVEARHSAALENAQQAAANVDVDALAALEAQVDHYLEAVGEVRGAAVAAGQLARENGHPAPGLNSVKSTDVEALHDRLRALSERLAGPSINAGSDLTFSDVKRVEIVTTSESAA